MNITKVLFQNQDLKYKEFHSRLMPSVEKDTVIGVRVPVLRKIAKEFRNDENCSLFLNTLPHKYYEENNLHAFLIEKIKDYDECINELNKFLPYVNNWATCDSMRPKILAKNADKLLFEIEKWIVSEHIYTVRFAIEMLMVYYLDEKFNEKFLEIVSEVKSDEYYINMMISWYFATALVKQWDYAIYYLERKKLPLWIHNKTIQKAVESYRISDEKKVYLKKLKKRKLME